MKFTRPNKSFELDKKNNDFDDFVDLKPKKINQILFIRRKSCHCTECGPLTNFQQKSILKPAKIRFHHMQFLRSKEIKKTINSKVKENNHMKRNSFLKFLPKKTSNFLINQLKKRIYYFFQIYSLLKNPSPIYQMSKPILLWDSLRLRLIPCQI